MNLSQKYTHQLPFDRGLEAAVLGAALLEAPARRMVLDKFGSRINIFYHPPHQHVFRAVQTLHQAGLDIDLETVVFRLKAQGKLVAAGGAAGVAELLQNVNGLPRLETHCHFLLELYTRRQMILAMQSGLQQAYNEQADVLELLAVLQHNVTDLNAALHLKRPQYVGELVNGVLKEIADATQRPKGVTGIPSGLTALDNLTGGWQKSDLIIVAARPAVGKTSLLVSVGMHAARAGKKGVIFTLEVSAAQLVLKMIAKEAGYTTSQLRRGMLNGGIEEAYAIADKVNSLRELGVLLDDTAGLSISALRAKAARLKAEENIEWLAVDYLQLMTGDRTSGNREQEISSISRGLKQLAKELNIPVIALAQLSREVEKRGGAKRPQLSDLRESGAIEQDADLIIFPYRAECYNIRQDDAGNSTADTTELIIAKHRNGATADIAVRSIMKFGRYEDLVSDDWST